MRDSKRFLEALECPEDAAASGRARYWPIGVPAEPALQQEHQLEYQFLDDHEISRYLDSLHSQDRPGNSHQKERFKVDFAALDRSWTADKYPLALCEFLAYQAGLAYRRPQQIQRHLLGVDHTGRRYKEGVDQFAFFDTSQPGSSVQHADTQAFAFTHCRTGYLIFRGTTGFSDWATNLNSELTTDAYPTLKTKPQTLVGSPKPARHKGFAIAWGSVAPDLEMWVRDQLRAGRIDKIVLSGHSLGGALAVLGGYHFASNRICPVHAVVTFGAPKVGGIEFKAAYENPRLNLRDRTLRIESAEDIVTLLSQRGDDQHVGHPWSFKKRPLRPSWQMLLFAPMVDAEQAAKSKVERLEVNQKKRRVRQEQPDAVTQNTIATPTNQPTSASAPDRTWQEFVLQMILKLLWYLARFFVHALAAHSVEHRYGLYLSTLSYQRIRQFRKDRSMLRCRLSGNQENQRIAEESALRAANRDLREHLRVTRGRHPKTFRYLANRPIRFNEPKRLSEYQTKYVNYIA